MPINGTPCDVPEPRNVNANDIVKLLLPNPGNPARFGGDNLTC